MPEEINFCQRCGRKLARKPIENTERPYCPGCGYVVFLDPKIAAIVLLLTDGKLVMVRRGIEPAMGHWSFPSGYVDRGEQVEKAAIREVKEETGLEARLDRMIGLYSSDGSPVVLAVYAGTVVGGSLKAGGDATDAALFSPETLPDLPFPNDAQILRDWRAALSDQGSGSAAPFSSAREASFD